MGLCQGLVPGCCNEMTSLSRTCRGEATSSQAHQGHASLGLRCVSGLFLKIMTAPPPGTFCQGRLLPHPGGGEFAGLLGWQGSGGIENPSIVVPQLVGRTSVVASGCL